MGGAWGAVVAVGLLAAVVGFGCAGDPAPETSGRGQPSGGLPTALAGTGGARASQPQGGQSGGQAGSGSDGSGFGNPQGNAPSPPLVTVTEDAGQLGPDEEGDCGGTEVEPMIEMQIIPGNVLLVFDRSGSMEDPWDVTDRAKYAEARDALTNALAPLQENISAGAIFFPDTPSCGGSGARGDPCSCFVPDFGSSPQIQFLPGSEFLDAWSTFWLGAPLPNGGTPLSEALQMADQALSSSTLEGITNVVVITDGEPNCAVEDLPTDEQIGILTGLPASWLAQGITTHVVGLPGIMDPEALRILDAVAAAGGTTQHLVPTDPVALETEVAKIIGESVTTNFDSCRIGLPSSPPDLEEVNLLVLEEGQERSVARDLGDGGGWTITADATEIILQGLFCELAQAGEYDKISVVFGCVMAPPLDPPRDDPD